MERKEFVLLQLRSVRVNGKTSRHTEVFRLVIIVDIKPRY